MELFGLSLLVVLRLFFVFLLFIFDFLPLLLLELLLLPQVLLLGLDRGILFSFFLLSGNFHCLFDISVGRDLIGYGLALRRFCPRLLILDRLGLRRLIVHLIELKFFLLELVVDLLVSLLTDG